MRNVRIHANRCTDYLNRTADGAAVYLLGSQPNSTITNNAGIIGKLYPYSKRQAPNCSLYFDGDGVEGFHVEGNLFVGRILDKTVKRPGATTWGDNVLLNTKGKDRRKDKDSQPITIDTLPPNAQSIYQASGVTPAMRQRHFSYLSDAD